MTCTEQIEDFWASFFGISPEMLRAPGVKVIPHSALQGWAGAWFFVRGASAIVTVPRGWMPTLEAQLAGTSPDDLLGTDAARNLFGAAFAHSIGPSFQGWLPPSRFRSARSEAHVRPLFDRDRAATASLRRDCSPVEWEHSGIEENRPELLGAFVGDELVAVAQLRSRGVQAVDPCVVTHPSRRGFGYGSHAVSVSVERAASSGKLVLYQTALSNVPAVALGRNLGFEHYATLLAVRLTGLQTGGQSRSP